jgi:hypothetical protein
MYNFTIVILCCTLGESYLCWLQLWPAQLHWDWCTLALNTILAVQTRDLWVSPQPVARYLSVPPPAPAPDEPKKRAYSEAQGLGMMTSGTCECNLRVLYGKKVKLSL